MGNGQSTSSGTKVLAKVARGDARAAQQVEEARAGYFHTSKGRRAALAVAAERGNCQLLASVYESAEQAKGSWQTRQDLLNAPGSKGQTLLMTSCFKGHLECVTYLLSKGADVMATNPKGETCLHIAAKNSHSSCAVRLLNSRINRPGAATRLADLVFTEGLEEVKYVDLHNSAGMTALHAAALAGSAATVQALVANGASVDAQITGSNLTPWLSRGSTALHIAAARGFHAVVDVLLGAQTPESGLDLRRVRNQRGLKPFQLARANGHSTIARQLCDTRSSQARRPRRRRNAGGGGVTPAKATTPEALLTMLIQRAKLLLTLKAMSSAPTKGVPGTMNLMAICTNGQAQESRVEQAAAEVLECSEAWRKGSSTAKPAGSILKLLTALDELPAAAMLNNAHALESNADKGRSNSSYASAAMVQAALNAMASSASADPMEASSTSLTPTTPLAAAVILQAALRSLAGSKKSSSSGGHSRRSRQSASHEGHTSSAATAPTSRTNLEPNRAAAGVGPVTPARGAADPAPSANSRRSRSFRHGFSGEDEPHIERKASPAHQLRASSSFRQPHSRSGSTGTGGTPRTPRTPPSNAPTAPPSPAQQSPFSREQTTAVPDRLQPQSVPATPEPAAVFGGNLTDLGRKMGTSPHMQAHGAGNNLAGVPSPSPPWQSGPQPESFVPVYSKQRAPAPKSKLFGLPSAEDIDALCDMDNPSHLSSSADATAQLHHNPAFETAPIMAPILTSGAGDYDDGADRPSSSGLLNTYSNGAYAPQYSSSSTFRPAPITHSRPNPVSTRQDAAEASNAYAHSLRLQSECDSSAYDEGSSSMLIHSNSNEEQNMHDLLEEDTDDIFYTQHGGHPDDMHNTQAEQLNTLELHGILGQHGYKLPELAGEQEEEEEESDGEAEGDDDADGDEDLDDDNELDDEDDEGSEKNLFKTMPARRKGEGEEDEGLCSICMDRPLEAQISGCDHQMCLQCAYQMCARGLASPLCPFCRGPINTFQPVQK